MEKKSMMNPMWSKKNLQEKKVNSTEKEIDDESKVIKERSSRKEGKFY